MSTEVLPRYMEVPEDQAEQRARELVEAAAGALNAAIHLLKERGACDGSVVANTQPQTREAMKRLKWCVDYYLGLESVD